MFERIISGSVFVKYRLTTVLLSIAMAMAMGYGAKNIYFESSYKVFFEPDNIQRVDYEAIQDQFTKNDTILYTLTPEDGVFRAEFFEAEKWLTSESWKLPKTLRVDSLSNFQHTEATEDELLVEDLVEDVSDLTPKKLDEIKSIALHEPLLLNRLIRNDTKSAGVVVSVNFDRKTPDEPVEVGRAAYELAERFEKNFPTVKIAITGSAVLNYAFSQASMQDAQTIIPLMYLIIILITYLSLRSIVATLSSLMVIVLSMVATVGLAGHLGFYLTTVSAITPTIVLTLAVADSIHILKTMLNYMRSGDNKIDAVIKSVRVNAKAVFITSFTTIVGFLSLNASAVPPYQQLGNMTAMGVAFAYFFSVVTLPALVSLLPIRVKKEKEEQSQDKQQNHTKALVNYSYLAEWVTSHSKLISSVTLALVIGAICVIPNMEFSDEPLKYFDTSMDFRRDTDFTTENLTGVEYLEISLPAKSGSVADPIYLKELEQFKTVFEKEPDIVHISSLTDIIKRLNKSMNADNQAYYKIPTDRELAAQYLLLYELSLPKGLDLGNVLDLNKSASKMIFTFANTNSSRLIEIEGKVRDYVKDSTTAIGNIKVGSVNLMFAHISKSNLESIVVGAAISFTVITFCLIIALRSIKYGLLSMVSNISPAIISFGLWSLIVGKADIAVSVASSVTFGVIVDFTVHFLSKYSLYRDSHSMKEAISKCFVMVGPPILSTASILIIGFAVLGLSPFRLNWVLGMLSATMILFSLLFLFIVMPSIIKLVDRDRTVTINEKNSTLQTLTT